MLDFARFNLRNLLYCAHEGDSLPIQAKLYKFHLGHPTVPLSWCEGCVICGNAIQARQESSCQQYRDTRTSRTTLLDYSSMIKTQTIKYEYQTRSPIYSLCIVEGPSKNLDAKNYTYALEYVYYLERVKAFDRLTTETLPSWVTMA